MHQSFVSMCTYLCVCVAVYLANNRLIVSVNIAGGWSNYLKYLTVDFASPFLCILVQSLAYSFSFASNMFLNLF